MNLLLIYDNIIIYKTNVIMTTTYKRKGVNTISNGEPNYFSGRRNLKWRFMAVSEEDLTGLIIHNKPDETIENVINYILKQKDKKLNKQVKK